MNKQDKYLIDIQKNWDTKVRSNLPSIDWLGEEITKAEINYKINAMQDLINKLFSLKRCKSDEIFGVAIKDSFDNLALGIALILEGVTQAIIPLDATKTQIEDLCERYEVTILATSESISHSGQWELTEIQTNDIYFYRESYHKVSIIKETNRDNLTEEFHSIRLLLGTTSGTTSHRSDIISLNSKDILRRVSESVWSPYNLVKRPLVGPSMQNWSARLQKLLLILRGKSFVVRNSLQPFRDQPIIQNCDGSLIAPNGLRRWMALENMQYLGENFLLISGSDQVPMKLRETLSQMENINLGITYATSQTGPLTWLPPNALLDEQDSVGWPLEEVSIQPIETQNSLYKNGKKFQEAIISTPRTTFNPGDLLHVSKTGQIIFGGRSNDTFLYNSIIISPTEIEDVVYRYTGVKECVAFGATSNRFGAVAMVGILLNKGFNNGQAIHEVDLLCRKYLGKKRPQKIIIMNVIPRNQSGKALRRVLSKQYSLQQ